MQWLLTRLHGDTALALSASAQGVPAPAQGVPAPAALLVLIEDPDRLGGDGPPACSRPLPQAEDTSP